MSISFKSNLPSDAEIATMFGTVGTFDKYKIGDKVITAGTQPILKRARELAPRDTSGHGRKRSKKQKNATGGSGVKINWDKALKTTIVKKVVKTEKGAYGIVGPKWPDGNKAYFNTGPGGNKGHLWGYEGKEYPTGRFKKDGTPVMRKAIAPRARIQIRNWIVQAADETRSQQLDAMKNKLTEVMGDVIRG